VNNPPFAPSAKTKIALSAKDGAPNIVLGDTKSGTQIGRRLGHPSNGETHVITTGPRGEILKLERWLTERAPGPENHEAWAGTKYSKEALRVVNEVLNFLEKKR
jgi:hypothetical protein